MSTFGHIIDHLMAVVESGEIPFLKTFDDLKECECLIEQRENGVSNTLLLQVTNFVASGGKKYLVFSPHSTPLSQLGDMQMKKDDKDLAM